MSPCYPLSFAQRRLWFVHEWDPGTAVYQYPVNVTITGALDPGALARALRRVVDRHWILRSRFEDRDGTPVQVVAANEFELELADLTALAAGDRQTAVRERVTREASEPFDLAVSPTRGCLLRTAEQEHILLLTFHHIVFDGWSNGVLAEELAAAYAKETGASGPAGREPGDGDAQDAALPLQYGDFAARQHEQFQGDALRDAASFWRRTLRPLPPELRIPTERPRPESLSGATGRVWIELDADLSGRLRELARSVRATPYMVLMATFQALLSCYSRQADFCVGGATAGRRDPATFGLIGLFVNQVVFRSQCASGQSFADLAARVRRSALDVYRHDHVPFELVVELAKPPRDASRHPLFQYALVMQPEADSDAALTLPGLRVDDLDLVAEGSALDMTMNFVVDGERFRAAIDFSLDLWTPRWAREFGARFVEMLSFFAADPGRRVDEFGFAASQTALSVAGRGPAPCEAQPDAGTAELPPVWAMLAARARDGAGEPAVYSGADVVSRGALQERAAVQAAFLRAAGVGAGDRVAVSLRRSVGLLAAVLGIWQLGAVFVPLDPGYPDGRIALILEDCGAGAVLCEAAQADRLTGLARSVPAARILTVQDRATPAADGGGLPGEPGAWPARPAYVIYTSGSTGRPKGVLVHHGALSRYVSVAGQMYAGATGTSPWHAPLGFDATITAVWVPLARGGSVAVVPGDEPADAVRHLAEMLGAGTPIGLLKITPAHLELIGSQTRRRAQIRTLVVGGEALHGSQIRPWLGRAEQIVNEYGPTETTVGVIVAQLDPGRPVEQEVPIGRPFEGVAVRIADAQGRVVPPGVVGEIYLGGPQVALGYLGRPSLTAERFSADPAGTGTRAYRTGDLGWLDSAGLIHYAGRADDQVKVSGHRVELGEVESVLAAHPAVAQAAVTLTDRQLVGYVVTARAGPDRPASDAVVGEWKAVFDETFGGRAAEPEFDSRGWTSSFDGERLPAGEMRAWRDQTVAVLRELPPGRVLEIGCGTGLLAIGLAGCFEEYVGTDLSAEPMRELGGVLDRLAPGKARLVVAEAADLSAVAGDFDLVVINSVIQYFPGADYAWQVLRQAWRRLRPGGRLFVGDVRHAGLARLFHGELIAARRHRTAHEHLAAQARRAGEEDVELLLDPRFFVEFGRQLGLPEGSVQVRPKLGDYANELSRYRYDVVITTAAAGPAPAADDGRVALDWVTAGLDLPGLRALLEADPRELVVRSVPNARLADVLKLVDGTTGDRRGADPQELIELARDHGYLARASWATAAGDGAFDLVLAKGPPPAPLPVPPQAPATGRWQDYATDPMRARAIRGLRTALRRHAEAALPRHAVPARLIVLPEMPLTPNGKVDRSALPAPPPPAGESRPAAARTPTERTLARIWADVLGLAEVFVHDRFFDLGGDSIIALQVVSKAKTAGLALPVREMFRHQTIAELAAALDRGDRRAAVATLGTGRPTGPVALTPIQSWFFEAAQESFAHFNFTAAYTVRPGTDVALLWRAVRLAADRHDALRLAFSRSPDGGWQQAYRDVPEALDEGAGRWGGVLIDVAGAAPADRDLRAAQAVRDWQGRLGARDDEAPAAPSGPLFRPLLVRLGADRHLLVLLAHHLVMDAVSARILAEDVAAAYQALRAGTEVTLPGRTSSFQCWSSALRQHAASTAVRSQLGYWRSVAATPAAALPVDHADAVDDVAGQITLSAELDPAATASLIGLYAARGTRVEEALLIALAQALHDWGVEGQVLIDLESHGREEIAPGVDVSRTVGWFTAMFPFALDPAATAAGAAGASALIERYRAIPHRGIGYGLLRYVGERLPRAASPIAFNYLGRFELGGSDRGDDDGRLLSAADLAFDSDRDPRWRRRHEIEVDVAIYGDRLAMSLTFNGRRYEEPNGSRLLDSFERRLSAMAAASGGREAPVGGTPITTAGAAGEDRGLEALIARDEIGRLKYRYARACDSKDLGAVRACFSDGTVDIDVGALGRFDDADDFTRAFAEVSLLEEDGRPAVFEMHHVHHPSIEVNGERATGNWTLSYRCVNLITAMQIESTGEYQDEYVRQDGEWRISKCHYRDLWTMSSPLPPAAEAGW